MDKTTEHGGQAAIYRPADLARLLGCRKSTLRAWELRGLLPPARRNGARFTYWLRTDIDAFLQGKTAGEGAA